MATEQEKINSQEVLKNVKEIEKTLQRINVESARNSNTFKDIELQLRKNQKVNEDTASAIGNANLFQKELKKTADQLSTFDKEKLKDAKKTQKFLENETKAKTALVGLQAQIKVLEEARNGESAAVQRQINAQLEKLKDSVDTSKQLIGNFDTIRELNEELNKKTEFFDKLAELADDVPVLGKFFGDFAKASSKIREEFGSNKFQAGLGALASLGGKALAVTGVAALKTADSQITSIARNLNVSRSNAAAFRGELIDAATKSGKPVSFLLEGIDAVNASLGTQGLISTDAAKQFSTLTHRLGLSTEEATKLFNATAATGMSFRELTNDVAGQTKMLNMTTGAAVDYKQVMKDIGEFSNATLLTQSKFAGGLTKAAFTARKLGLEMSGLENIAGNLLNFEESIAAELEAELITGKQLNLDNARAAALKGDMVTLAEELNAQNITADSFGKMNVLAQEAQAKALGMSREEMATMLNKQEQLKKVAKELNDNTILQADTEEKIQKIMKAKNIDRSAALKMLGEEEMATQALNVEASTKLKEAAMMIKESFKPDLVNAAITTPLNFLTKTFGGIASMMSNVAVAALAYYAIRGLSGGSFRASNLLRGGKGGGGGLIKSATSPTGFRNAAGQFAKAPKAGGGMLSGLFKGGMKGPSVAGMGSMFGMGAVASGGTKAAGGAGKKVASNIAKAGGKTAAKGVGKSMLKKIPIVGTLAGIGFGISRAMQGDFTGAAMEVASGLAANIPGAGTAVSAAIDVGLVGRDIYKNQSRGNIDSTVKEVGQLADNQQSLEMKKIKLMESNLNIQQKLLEQRANININGSKVNDVLDTARTNVAV